MLISLTYLCISWFILACVWFGSTNPNFILGIEARGFIFGPSIALAIGAKFVPLRKPRKLPGIHSIIVVNSLELLRLLIFTSNLVSLSKLIHSKCMYIDRGTSNNAF